MAADIKALKSIYMRFHLRKVSPNAPPQVVIR